MKLSTQWPKGSLGKSLGVIRCNAVSFLILSALATIAVLSKVIQYYSYQIHDWDTGIYSNVVWHLVSGDGFHSDVLNRNLLGEHFSPIIAVFVPFFAVYPSPVWLVAAQGLSVGTTYVLLYFAALKIFHDADSGFAKPLALIFALWAFLYRPLTSALLFEFHPSTLATPLLAAAVLALLHSRDRVLWLLVAVLLLSKENASLAVLGLGFYAGLVLSRPRLGIALGLVAVVSAVLVMGVLMPLFRTGDWQHYGRLGPFAEWQQKTIYLLGLVTALGFLPLLSWRSLMCAVPLIGLNLSVAYFPQFSMQFHYDDFASVFLLVAAMHGAVVALRAIGSASKGWRAFSLFVVIGLVALLLVQLASPSAPIFYLLKSRSDDGERQLDQRLTDYLRLVQLVRPSAPIFYLLKFWPGDKEQQLHQDLAKYRRLPIETGIAAQSVLGPYLSARQRYVSIYAASQGLDMQRLKPGDMVLITPIDSRFAELKRLLEKTPGLTKVHVSSVLSVYQVTGLN